MILQPASISGAYLYTPERSIDERGYFARTWCYRTFEQQGLDPCVMQCSVAFNRQRGTLRGMHYQAEPQAEAKLVRVTRGAVYDVAVDMRSESSTYRQWMAVELAADTGQAVYLPAGCAHGYLTLEDDTELFYMISREYSPEHVRGFRWDDPAVGILWPAMPSVVSDRDRQLPCAPWSNAEVART